MNKKLKRIIAITLIIGAVSSVLPANYKVFNNEKVYASTKDDYLLKKLSVFEAKSGDEVDLLDSEWKKTNFNKKSKENYCVKVDSNIDSIRIDTSTDSEDYAIYKDDGKKNYKGKDILLYDGITKIYIKTYDSKSDADDDKNVKKEYKLTVKKFLNSNEGISSSDDNESSSNLEQSKYNDIKNQNNSLSKFDNKVLNNAKRNQWVIANGLWQYNNYLGDSLKDEWYHDTFNDKWYFLDSYGNMVTGWLNKGEQWYYFDSNGEMVTGWRSINGQWYYFNLLGKMMIERVLDNGKWYYFLPSGEMI
ncbi:N-acetylmuramoyl-L-alanine amidase family protein [Clostridium botulinum]|uniref:N-acetylmuramoyl-L-alanine amidase family protein n=1 Tax=Clostridium botulinum TaxID=1491 RepID=UPI001C9A4C6F|nr:cadherin-like beta sandwich domain-containing protein [Clostridium botulinum]MBY6809917.1 cadherin-like beta sandwich domain-containing protein [Clostridium botulinum]MBY6823573.1 cadherin-like beta sandwich domain-containing protein [Clostridium botulinum]MBY6834184.1 cadherin-like beta sandwich domain-containing protein [Clostridium botulinum]MBY6972531.1 cadherin-like beta sandwich domain-containing protein [Clostridium botulinum]